MQGSNELQGIVQEAIDSIRPLDEKEALKTIWDEAEELEGLVERHRPVIMVAGNLGLGKTTTARVIATFGKARIDREDTEKELLQLYYEDMRKYAERLQIDLIAQRLNNVVINSIKYPNTGFVYDRTPYEDPLIFARALSAYDQMSSEAVEFCMEYFKMKVRELQRRFPQARLEPDLIVMLDATVENGWKRVNIRGRKMELKEDARKGHGLTFEFYSLLHSYYQTFPKDLEQLGWYKGPVLVLKEDEFEVADVTNIKGQLYVIRTLKEALKRLY